MKIFIFSSLEPRKSPMTQREFEQTLTPVSESHKKDLVCKITFSFLHINSDVFFSDLFTYHFNNVKDVYVLKPLKTGYSVQGLSFRAGWRDSRPKFRNPVEKNREDGRLPP